MKETGAQSRNLESLTQQELAEAAEVGRDLFDQLHRSARVEKHGIRIGKAKVVARGDPPALVSGRRGADKFGEIEISYKEGPDNYSNYSISRGPNGCRVEMRHNYLPSWDTVQYWIDYCIEERREAEEKLTKYALTFKETAYVHKPTVETVQGDIERLRGLAAAVKVLQ